jgi:hypothetical protein
MLRILLYVAALVCLFGGAIVYGGNAIGAWDPLPPAPTPPPAVKVHHTKPAKKSKPPDTVTTPAPTGPKTPAEKAWVRSANGLCHESTKGVNAIVAQATDAGSFSGGVALFERIRSYNKTMNDRFLALKAPASYKPEIAKLRALFAKEEHIFDLMHQTLQRTRNMKPFFRLSDRLLYVALDETDIISGLGAYGCDVNLPSLFGVHY